MAAREFMFVGLGVALALAAVVGFTDAGPVDVRVELDRSADSGRTGAEGPNDGEGISLLDESTPTPAATETQRRPGTDGPPAGESPDTATPVSTDPANDLDTGAIEYAIHERVNEIRAERGLSRLRIAGKLESAARYHSRDMAERGYLAHTSPDGETRADRYDRFGYACRVDTGVGDEFSTGAENVASTWADATVETANGSMNYDGNETAIARGVVARWMDSERHRQTLLREYWEYEGVGVATAEVDGATKVYVTQNFC